MNIIGIDPGANGCLCHLTDDDATFIDFKKEGLTGYIQYLTEIHLSTGKKPLIVLERVHAMPGQGVKSMFSFGQRLGELEGVLQALSLAYVFSRPQEWQKACGIPPKSGKKGIHEALAKIYPAAVLKGPKGGIMDGRCDALGLSHFGRKTY